MSAFRWLAGLLFLHLITQYHFQADSNSIAQGSMLRAFRCIGSRLYQSRSQLVEVTIFLYCVQRRLVSTVQVALHARSMPCFVSDPTGEHLPPGIQALIVPTGCNGRQTLFNVNYSGGFTPITEQPPLSLWLHCVTLIGRFDFFGQELLLYEHSRNSIPYEHMIF